MQHESGNAGIWQKVLTRLRSGLTSELVPSHSEQHNKQHHHQSGDPPKTNIHTFHLDVLSAQT
jgi:hypothetical protein